MYAVVKIGGHQFKVQEGQKLYVNRLPQEEGSSVVFDEVLLLDNDGDISVGTPVVSGVAVKAEVLSHLKDDKVIVFKKKRRKGYRVKKGHRQYISKIEIVGIGNPDSFDA